jgi:hypothetical protein
VRSGGLFSNSNANSCRKMNSFLENLRGTSALRTARFLPAASQPEEPTQSRKRARETAKNDREEESEGEDFAALAHGAITAADDGIEGRGDAGGDDDEEDDAVAPFLMNDDDEDDGEDDDEDDDEEEEDATADDDTLASKYVVEEEDPSKYFNF